MIATGIRSWIRPTLADLSLDLHLTRPGIDLHTKQEALSADPEGDT
ncbi:hypothetical protein OG394_15550 [Kribbella sp. NBC_01245]|nr:hypothetical protein [Kribbella sp. NBC_01245]